MTSRMIAMILGGCLSFSLGGCVAAIIPVAAGGMIGRSRMHAHGHDIATATTTVLPPDMRTAAPVSSGAVTTAIPPAPVDPATMKMGTAYVGQLPVPGSRGAQPVLSSAVVPHEEDNVNTRWSDVLRYVATASEKRPDADAFPVKARTAEDRHWLACGTKPSAVVVNLDATTVEGAPTYLRSIETLGLVILYTSRQPSAVALRQANGLRKDGVQMPVAGRTLIFTPGRTDDFAARYCVLSIVGTAPQDFPSSGMPNAQHGWFMIKP